MLPAIACPGCGASLSGTRSPAASSFATCARRCETCGIAFSNGLTNPTVIYRDPLQNIPWQTHGGALEALEQAVNVRSRPTKARRFGFETSEDALTWTVFSYLASEPGSMDLILAHLGMTTVRGVEPTVLLWGSPLGQTQYGRTIRERLIQVSDNLAENPVSRSEPDVLIDLGPSGLVIIEVKYRSSNDNETNTVKFDRYLDERFFLDLGAVKATGLYELTRNWRIGCEMAQSRPLTLVNLVMAPTLKSDRHRLERFSSALRTGEQARFAVVEWASVVGALSHLMPQWLIDYLDLRMAPRSPRP